MKTKNTPILYLLFIIIACSSCVRDGVDECPEGDVRINLYVEKFQNRSEDPLFDREQLFCERVNHIRYYLYQNGVIKEQGIIDTFNDRNIGFYSFNFTGLEYGTYDAVFVANCTGNALTGDPSSSANLLLTYPGTMDTEDYFTAVFPFTVDYTDPHEYTVGLLRAHGVVRYTFNNLPDDAIAIGVSMENVGLEKWVTGDYANTFVADRNYDVIPVTRQSATEDYIMGTFPTVRDGRSTFRLGLYRDGERAPYLSQMISDTLTIRRNQLLDISVTYENGTFRHEIIMDNSWNGSNPGGEVGIN